MGTINQKDELGRRQGLWVYYFDDGKIKRITNYLNNIKHGERLGYFSNGNIAWKEIYVNGELEGESIEYYFGLQKLFKYLILKSKKVSN